MLYLKNMRMFFAVTSKPTVRVLLPPGSVSNSLIITSTLIFFKQSQ